MAHHMRSARAVEKLRLKPDFGYFSEFAGILSVAFKAPPIPETSNDDSALAKERP